MWPHAANGTAHKEGESTIIEQRQERVDRFGIEVLAVRCSSRWARARSGVHAHR
jgi:hypothetical protein